MGVLFTTGKRTEKEIFDEYDEQLKEQKESSDFFALIKSFYNNDEYNKFTKNEKDKMAFMVNRRMSIRHPFESAALSKMGIAGYAIVDFWKDAITTQYKTYPSWLYTKTVTSPKNKNEEKFSKFNSDTINLYLKRHDIEQKTLDEYFKRYPEDVLKELSNIEKLLTQSVIREKNKQEID